MYSRGLNSYLYYVGGSLLCVYILGPKALL